MANVMIINFCHRDFPVNYGQTLLAYAFSEVVKEMGHNPITVSYTERNAFEKNWYLSRLMTPDKKTVLSLSFSAISEFIKSNMTFIPAFCRNDVYEISKLCNIWCIGGDVTWRKKYLGEIFTLDFGSPNVRRVAYSPSIYGYDDESKVIYHEAFHKIKQNFDCISFREEAGIKAYVETTGDVGVTHAIDPIFLIKDKWCKIEKKPENIRKKFVVIYILGDIQKYITYIEEVRKENHDKQIIVIPTSKEWEKYADSKRVIGVREFIWLFRHAELIVTNSFHGIAFSVCFERNFIICERKNLGGEAYDIRVKDFINKIGIKNVLNEKTWNDIDYGLVRRNIEEWQAESVLYLKKALNSEKTTKELPKVYAAKNKNVNIKSKSSSGGVFYEIAKQAINEKGVVYGAAWNKDFSVEHIRVTTHEKIEELMQSKYVQSRMNNKYSEVLKDIKQNKYVVFSGTPCQIMGLKNYLKGVPQDKLLTVGLICHGVPMEKEWKDYLETMKKEYGETINNISFRSKIEGWKELYLVIEFKEEKYCRKWKDDFFCQRFLGNKNLMTKCFNCVAKDHLQLIDIILGDFWRFNTINAEFDDDKGISAVALMTRKGQHQWENVMDHFEYVESDFSTLSRLNYHLEHSAYNPKCEEMQDNGGV